MICAVKWIFRDKEFYNFADQIPGPRAYAVIGSAHKVLKKSEHGEVKGQGYQIDDYNFEYYPTDRFEIVRGILDKYQENRLIKFWLGPILFVFVNDPELIEQVLDSSKCLNKSFFYKFLKLDKGLLVSKRESILMLLMSVSEIDLNSVFR